MIEQSKFQHHKPFVVSFSNIPFIYNGKTQTSIKGVSCFSYLILKHQGGLDLLNDAIHYSFTSLDFEEESFTNSNVVSDRWHQVCEFMEQHFSFFKDVHYENKEHLFVYSTFLDQLATDCFKYIGFKTPTITDYLNAYNEINLLALHKDISLKQVDYYKEKLLTTLSIEKPDIFCQMLFHPTTYSKYPEYIEG